MAIKKNSKSQTKNKKVVGVKYTPYKSTLGGTHNRIVVGKIHSTNQPAGISVENNYVTDGAINWPTIPSVRPVASVEPSTTTSANWIRIIVDLHLALTNTEKSLWTSINGAVALLTYDKQNKELAKHIKELLTIRTNLNKVGSKILVINQKHWKSVTKGMPTKQKTPVTYANVTEQIVTI